MDLFLCVFFLSSNKNIRLGAVYWVYSETVFLDLAIIRIGLDSFHQKLFQITPSGVVDVLPGDNVKYYGKNSHKSKIYISVSLIKKLLNQKK